MIKFAHIAPEKHVDQAAKLSDGVVMALEDRVRNDSSYRYKMRKLANAGYTVYLDNNFFELGYACSVEDLISAGGMINATYLITPDADITEAITKVIHDAGFKVMVIPAGEDLKADFVEALHRTDIDLVGLSYSKTSAYFNRPQHSSTSRFDFLNLLEEPFPYKKIHLLGSVSAGEVALMKPFEYAIESWDSSLAIWAGICNLDIRNMSEKNSISVDFNDSTDWNLLMTSNVDYIKKLQKL